jgi:hypothetical protein
MGVGGFLVMDATSPPSVTIIAKSKNMRILLPGASKEVVKATPEFNYVGARFFFFAPSCFSKRTGTCKNSMKFFVVNSCVRRRSPL